MSTGDLIYTEKVSSHRTEVLFLTLTLLFFLLFIWRVNTAGRDLLAAIFLCGSCIFIFYSINYRTLTIRLGSESLMLIFGIFRWKVPLDNVENCSLDNIPVLMRLGGAGIHFMSIRNRYRVSFNFLEYPRVVVSLKKQTGPVKDISFSTRRPDEVISLIQAAISASTGHN
jgi:Ca2+/Na+ antiporter